MARDNVCIKNMNFKDNDLNITGNEDNHWEMNLINDVTMADITRAVNAFITNNGSSIVGHVFPKKEIELIDKELSEELCCLSNTNINETVGTNNNVRRESIMRNIHSIDGMHPVKPVSDARNIDMHTNIFENRTVHKDSFFPKMDNVYSTVLGNKNVGTVTDRNDMSTEIIDKPKLDNPLLRALIGEGGGSMCGVVGKKKTAEKIEVISGELDLESERTSSSITINATLGTKAPKRVEFIQPKVNQRYYLCPIKDCNLIVSSRLKLDIHVRKNHKSEGFRCAECGKRLSCIDDLEQHENFHKGIMPYKCKICGKNFDTNKKMYVHFRAHHLPPRNFSQCEICGAVGSTSFLSTHMKRTHLKVRYQCKECKEEFWRPQCLEDHKRMHQGERPYKCDLCPKTFVQKRGMLAHVKRHSRKFQCPKCDKSFKSKEYLVGHLLLHDGIKKHCCNVCGKTFAQSHYLFTHMKSHGEKHFECAICGGKFNRKDNLKSHVIKHQTTGRKNLKKTRLGSNSM